MLALDPASCTGWAEATTTAPGRAVFHGAGAWDLGAGWRRPMVLRGLLRDRLSRAPRITALCLEVHLDHGVTVVRDGKKQRVQAVHAAHLSGALLFAVHEVAELLRVPVVEVTPTAAKAAAGGGRFNKDQVRAAARGRFGLELGEDAADALFVLCAAHNVLHLDPETP